MPIERWLVKVNGTYGSTIIKIMYAIFLQLGLFSFFLNVLDMCKMLLRW